MRSGNLPRRFLVQSILLVLHGNLIKAGNLAFYRDVEPEQPMDVNYEEIARILEAEKLAKMREMNHNKFSPHLPWPYIEYLYYQQQKEKKILEALLENPSMIDGFNPGKTKERSMIPESLLNYEMPEDPTEINEPEGPRPYMSVDPLSDRYDDYSNLKIPYAKNIFRNEKLRYVRPLMKAPFRMSHSNIENHHVENTDGERITKLGEKFREMNKDRLEPNEDESSRISEGITPLFTFKFDEPKVNEPNPFAVKPNDPRYYEQDESSTESVTINHRTTADGEKNLASFLGFGNSDKTMEGNYFDRESEYSTENIRNDKFSIMKIVLPEAHRRSEHDTVIVSSSPIMTNDIYFIAVVAGCSAAAMFALVLISLTWCRLQRGAKAAADIEYPAYGVTGPNKDISPSGDQRLAHSAQMYHFQHQKQQIIAMENRTAASRDPGSVSEAESDEENEEGDYTVYECPGLASAGEMEVKNPMFNDDPTPVTSPQIHKDEDHIQLH